MVQKFPLSEFSFGKLSIVGEVIFVEDVPDESQENRTEEKVNSLILQFHLHR